MRADPRGEARVADLIRFVVGPDDVLVPDTDAKAEGRGVWISLGETFVAEAVKKKAFAKSLKTAVTVPDDLPALTRLRLEQRFVTALQMARKSGQLLTGAMKVKAALETGEAIALADRDRRCRRRPQEDAGDPQGVVKSARKSRAFRGPSGPISNCSIPPNWVWHSGSKV